MTVLTISDKYSLQVIWGPHLVALWLWQLLIFMCYAYTVFNDTADASILKIP